jgi:hypothetical protein
MPATARSRLRQAAIGLFLCVASFALAPPAPAQSRKLLPIPPGDARFWFYRVFFPLDTQSVPAIWMNGATIGYGYPGFSFYRDLPAGRYHIGVETTGVDVNQSQDIAAAPGEVVYVKIASLPDWDEGALGRWRRPTYYVMIVPPGLAALELPETTFGSGRG